MRYTYLGDKLTGQTLIGMQCDPVKWTKGKEEICVVGHTMATALVIDGAGRRHVVLRRRLRLNK